MKNQLRFRRGRLSDCEQLSDVRIKAIEASESKFSYFINEGQALDWKLRDDVEKIKECVKDSSRIVDVAIENSTNRIVGFSVSTQNEIEKLFVLPSTQGLGVGQNLMRRMERRFIKYAKDNHLPLVAKVDSFASSRSFYERMGFVAISIREFKLDHSVIYTYWMVKDLSKSSAVYAPPQSLDEARERIDSIDMEILNLIVKRFMLTEYIGECKAREQLSAYDKNRERAQAEKLQELAKYYALPNALMQNLFTLLRSEAKQNHLWLDKSGHFDV